jgi:hypothetical protein
MSYRTRPRKFYEDFKNDTEAAKRVAFQLGREMGQEWKERYNIQGDDLEAVAEILNAAMRNVVSDPTARVEGNKVIMENRSFCVIMRASLSLNLPWEWMDKYYAWPWLEGIVSVIRPDIKMKVLSARHRGDKVCVHSFEIE